MEKNFISWAFAFIFAILLLSGIVFIIGSFGEGGGESAFNGLLCISGSFFILGFGRIVEAAYVYLEKNKVKE